MPFTAILSQLDCERTPALDFGIAGPIVTLISRSGNQEQVAYFMKVTSANLPSGIIEAETVFIQ